MWAGSVLLTASSVTAQLVDGYSRINSYVTTVCTFVMSLGLGGFQANVIQFGIDQLHDASTTEIVSFISWYVCALISGEMVIDLLFWCTQQIFEALLMNTNLSIALILNCFLSHWLIKEPVTQNPFKLVYQVIKYAIENKYPRHRSAFTYCEDDLPSRIDFGKNKYGGPFTTEQVEDVKTFLRTLPIIMAGGIFCGEIVAVYGLNIQLIKALTDSHHTYFSEETYLESAYYGGVVLIVIQKFILYPLFQKCFPHVNSHCKFGIGALLQILRLVVLMIIEFTAQHSSLMTHGYNTCLLYTSPSPRDATLSRMPSSA